jgi:putative resolvase
MENLYTLQESADYLKVHYSTVYRWVQSGQLKANKVGNHWRVPESELKRLAGSVSQETDSRG